MLTNYKLRETIHFLEMKECPDSGCNDCKYAFGVQDDFDGAVTNYCTLKQVIKGLREDLIISIEEKKKSWRIK